MPDPVVLAILASLNIPGGTAWVDQREVHCLAEIIWHEARDRHLDAQAGTGFAALDRAAYAGQSVCASIERRAYPWASKRHKREARIKAHYAERLAWERAEVVARAAYLSSDDLPILRRPCPGNPTHFDRWRSRPWAMDPWKHKFRIRCWLDGIAFWEER